MRRALVVLAVAAGLGLVAACSNEKIVLAIDDNDAGQMGHRVKCDSTADCQASAQEYCSIDRPDLGVGHCEHKPNFCEHDPFQPVCAPSSGISYLNDCYRKRAGEPYSTPGECVDNVRLCDRVSLACPTGAVCAFLGGGDTGDKLCGGTVGRCWGIGRCSQPDDDADDHDGWDECSNEGGALRCVDGCHAIQSSQKFTHHDNCR